MSLKFFSLIFVSFWSWFLSRRWKCLIPRATFLWPMARQELCEGGCPPVNYIFDVKITDFRGGRFYNATITRQIIQRNKNFTLGLNGIKNSYDWKILVPKNLTDRKSKKKKIETKLQMACSWFEMVSWNLVRAQPRRAGLLILGRILKQNISRRKSTHNRKKNENWQQLAFSEKCELCYFLFVKIFPFILRSCNARQPARPAKPDGQPIDRRKKTACC